MVTRRPDLLWLAGSAFFYELLPELRETYPDLKVLDLLFNTVVHTADNRRFRDSIDLHLVENDEVRRWLLRAGEDPARVVLVESGVDLELYRPKPKDPRLLAALGVEPDAFVVGFSGRLSEEKSPGTFVDMAQLLRHERGIVFLMTGAGPLAEVVRGQIASLGLGDRVRFLGQVDDVRDYLALYDVLVLPSRLDGRPLVVLESLAMGIPVVASRVGALPRLVVPKQTGFLCRPAAPRGFATRVRWLAHHPNEHQAMRVAARAFAERNLDARRMAERYEGAIRSLLTRPETRSAAPVADAASTGRSMAEVRGHRAVR